MISTTISEVAGIIRSIAEVGTAVIAVTDAIGLTDVGATRKVQPIETKTYSTASKINSVCDIVLENIPKNNDSESQRAFRYVDSSIQFK